MKSKQLILICALLTVQYILLAQDFNYPTPPSIENSQPGIAVGGMGGQFSVSPMGGATYSIPIEVPMGVNGLQPNLSIVYNSQSGNGLCGYGASLSGLSAITHGPKDIYHDGTAKGVTYLADDALYLDGVRLILTSGTAGQNNAVYHPESDPFTTVTAKTSGGPTGNSLWFEVESSDGMTYWYGKNPDSRLSYTVGNSPRIHSWYMCHAQQPTGNYMTYYYEQQDSCVYPSHIVYGANINHNTLLTDSIVFTYDENREDSILIRYDGIKAKMRRRLKHITGSTNGNIYRSYTLNYSTSGDGTEKRYSRLTSVTEKNGQNESLPSVHFAWSYLPQLNYNSNSPNIPAMASTKVALGDQNFSVSDLNGDGIDDIIGYGKSNDTNDHKLYLYKYMSYRTSNGNISFTDTLLHTVTPSYTTISGDYSDYYYQAFNTYGIGGSTSLDINGDGDRELMIGHRFRSFSGDLSTGDTIENYVEFLILGYDNSDYYRTLLAKDCLPLYSTGDVDNNGMDDIVILETDLLYGLYCKLHIISSAIDPSYYTYNWAGLPISNSLDYDLYLMNIPKRLFISDMNGDGLNDLFVIFANGYVIYWNQGGGLYGDIFSNAKKSTGNNLTDVRSLTPGDFNGDGLLDMLSNTGTNDWYILYNNGDGSFSQSFAFNNSTLADQNFTDRDDNQLFCNVLDYDGDGVSDVIISKSEYERKQDYFLGIPIGNPWGEFQKVHTYWMHSTKNGMIEDYHATSTRLEDIHSNRYMTGDFNGDGRVELINYGYDCAHGNNSDSDPIWRLYTNNNLTANSGKVTSITGDFGVITEITYATLSDHGVYTRGIPDAYPVPKYTLPMNVVKQTVQGNGASGNLITYYTYEGLKIHLCGRGLMGFSKTTSTCTTTGTIIESGISQWDTVNHIPKITYFKTSIGGNSSRTDVIMSITDMGQKKYFAYPSITIDIDMDGDTISNYRLFNTTKGYLLSDSTVYGTSMYRSVSYQDYTANKVGGVYRPQRIVMSQRHPDDDTSSPVFKRITAYTYNNKGQVTQEIENQQSQNKSLTTGYTYDIWGNKTSQVSSGSGITTPCTTYYTYDQTHRFPARIFTNPTSSVIKYTYNVFGNVLSEQDSINSSINNTKTHTYNGWGQLIRTDMSDGSYTTMTRGWNNDAGKRYYILSQGTSSPWVKTWYDNQGREVMTESRGPNDVEVKSKTDYDNKGLVTRHEETSGNLTLTHSYSYDTRGRVISETAPGNVSTTYQYGNRSVTVSKNSRTTTTTYDAWGNVKTVTAPVSSVTNTYSSNGGIKETVAGGATWTFGYDDRGNRISMTDPDAGTTTYVYDALGRETSRTDGRGVVFLTYYDYLGRVTQRKADSDVINYTYWTSGNGQMSLKSESNGNWTKSYAYDNLRRVTSETMSNGTVTKTKTYQYGTNGLLTQRTVPGSKTYVYSYDAYGNLTCVNFNSGTVKWDLSDYTGKVTESETVIDNESDYPFVRTSAIDSYGLPDYITTTKNGDYYQIENLSFSPYTGNLSSKSNYILDYIQTFGYDNADRLTSVYQNNQNVMSLTYAQNGNITSKTGMGSYSYGTTSRPHAVTAVDNTAGILNMNEQYVSYDSWGNACSVWQTDNNDFYSHSIEYGPDLKRVTSETHRTYNTLYTQFYWDDYEEKTIGNDVLQYYYVYGGDGLAGLHIVKTSPNNQVTTHTTKVMTDHLGSIVALLDNEYWSYVADFDAWGKRQLIFPYFFDPYFDRGYTGHQHLLDMLGLINMNGRMYDPNLGRFLSPDNYIQSPYNPQNYNRYSYCLNNPLKYIDPSGEIFGTLFGLISDVIDNIGRTFKWEKWDWTQTKYGWEIDKGFFMTDPNKSTKGRFKEFFSRITNQVVQTVSADLYVSVMNALGKVNGVTHGYGVTAVDMGLDGKAVTPSYISIGPEGYKADWRDHMFVHEYGHYLQSQELGIKYLYTVCLPSLQSAIIDTDRNNAPNHDNRWFETDANRRAAEYFDKYYGSGCADYDSNSGAYFDINSFRDGTLSNYINPRRGDNNRYPEGHPFESTTHWTDPLVTIPLIGVIPYYLYK